MHVSGFLWGIESLDLVGCEDSALGSGREEDWFTSVQMYAYRLDRAAVWCQLTAKNLAVFGTK